MGGEKSRGDSAQLKVLVPEKNLEYKEKGEN